MKQGVPRERERDKERGSGRGDVRVNTLNSSASVLFI